MDPNVKALLHTLVAAVMYLLLFLIVLPPLMEILGRPAGRALYGLLVVGGVAFGFRLRTLAKKL
ncbi:MAG: hypothetical protein E6Q99_05190 [Elusimicrobia bacterium]|nr:MAG: hypothetical protein E6Q99_05190 [Elusimicrobiota bacterium]